MLGEIAESRTNFLMMEGANEMVSVISTTHPWGYVNHFRSIHNILQIITSKKEVPTASEEKYQICYPDNTTRKKTYLTNEQIKIG